MSLPLFSFKLSARTYPLVPFKYLSKLLEKNDLIRSLFSKFYHAKKEIEF